MSRFYEKIKSEVKDLGFSIIYEDFDRPWGGFFQIDERQSQKENDQRTNIKGSGTLSKVS